LDSDQALSFPGGTVRGNVAYAAWMDTPSFTVVATIKPTANGGNIISRYSTGNFTNSVFALRTDGGTLSAFYFSGGAYNYVQVGAVPIGTVSDVAMTYDHTTTTITTYINGILQTSGPRVQNVGTTNVGLSIGNDFTGAEPYNGIIDEAMYFGTVLTKAQIENLYYLRTGPTRAWSNSGSLGNNWTIGANTTRGLPPIPTGSPGTAAASGGASTVATAVTPTALQTVTNPQTVELWFTKPASAEKGALFKIGAPDAGGWGMGIGTTNFDTAGHNLVLLRESINWHVIGSALTTAQHHLVVTLTGSTFQVYLDNVKVQDGSFGGVNGIVAGASMAFGGYNQGGTLRYLSAAVPIDRCAIYGSVLSAARVAAHWNGGAGDDAAVAADSPLTLLDLSTTVDLGTEGRLVDKWVDVALTLDSSTIAGRLVDGHTAVGMNLDSSLIAGRLVDCRVEVAIQVKRSYVTTFNGIPVRIPGSNAYVRTVQ
jgi:hypothetical protein